MDVHDLVLKDGDVRAVENKLEGIKIIRDFLTKKEEQTLINSVDGSPWNEEIKRRTQQYGAKYDYRTRGASRSVAEEAPVPPMPPFFDFLVKRLLEHGFYSEEHPPDQCIVNEYIQSQGILRHTDAVNLWGPTVCTVSLGDPVVMEFTQSKKHDPTGENQIDLILEPRSLVVFTGPSRYIWQHGINKGQSFTWKNEKYARGKDFRRISLTFRTIALEEAPPKSKKRKGSEDS